VMRLTLNQNGYAWDFESGLKDPESQAAGILKQGQTHAYSFKEIQTILSLLPERAATASKRTCGFLSGSAGTPQDLDLGAISIGSECEHGQFSGFCGTRT
jgi:hypothetical protein